MFLKALLVLPVVFAASTSASAVYSGAQNGSNIQKSVHPGPKVWTAEGLTPAQARHEVKRLPYRKTLDKFLQNIDTAAVAVHGAIYRDPAQRKVLSIEDLKWKLYKSLNKATWKSFRKTLREMYLPPDLERPALKELDRVFGNDSPYSKRNNDEHDSVEIKGKTKTKLGWWKDPDRATQSGKKAKGDSKVQNMPTQGCFHSWNDTVKPVNASTPSTPGQVSATGVPYGKTAVPVFSSGPTGNDTWIRAVEESRVCHLPCGGHHFRLCPCLVMVPQQYQNLVLETMKDCQKKTEDKFRRKGTSFKKCLVEELKERAD